MRTFIATNGQQVFTSGYVQCVAWARQLNTDLPTIIHTARGGDREARVIAEVTGAEEVRQITDGRLISVSGLYRHV